MTLKETVDALHPEVRNFFDFSIASVERLGTSALTMADAREGVRIANPSVNGQRGKSLPVAICGLQSARAGVATVGKIILVTLLLFCTGCATVRPRPEFVIPARCIAIRVQSFTKPCTSRQDGKFVCDGVVIAANCMAPNPRQSPSSR